MAQRVEPNADLVFGTMAAAVAVTHVRFQKAGANPVVRALSSTLNVALGERLRVPSNMFDVVYKAGQLTDNHLSAVVTPYWNGETFQIDCMTNSTTPVADANYSQQTHSGWTITQEAD